MYRRIILVAFSIVLFSCSKEELDIQNLNGNKIFSIGHSGMGIFSQYPRNSYESLIKALNLGADGLEIDIQLTKDNHLIAFHDEDLSQSASINGLVRSLNWSEIKGSTYLNPIYSEYAVISLHQLFSNINNLNSYQYILDCKLFPNSEADSNGDPEYYNDYVYAMQQLIEEFNLSDNIYIESYRPFFLELVQTQINDHKLLINSQSFDEGLAIANRLNLFGISMGMTKINQSQVESAHANNKFVSIWGVRRGSANMDAIDKNPDLIQTDNLNGLIKLLE